MNTTEESGRFVQHWLRLAGLLTWATVGATFVVDFAEDPTHFREARYALWAVAYFSFAALFLADTGAIRRRPLRLAAAAAQTACAFAIAGLPGKAVGFIFLVLVAAQLASILEPRRAAAWVALQSAGMGFLYTTFLPLQLAVAYIGVYLGFQAFAYVTARTIESEGRARRELARVNSELRAAQSLVSESHRVAERMRIARDLHDVLGHRLTAIGLNLETARHLATGPAREPIERARDQAHSLLAEVRDVVSELRGSARVDLGAALRALADGCPSPRVHVDLGDAAAGVDAARAETLLRCAQEIVTNAMKHAAAENLWLALERTADGVVLRARDDGRGAVVVPGNGLRGMRERLAQSGGRLDVESRPGAGFSLAAFLPAGGAAA